MTLHTAKIATPLAALLLSCSAAAAQNSLPQIERLEVNPSEIHLDTPFAYAQLVVTAHHAGGISIDATRLADYSVKGSAATVNPSAVVEPAEDGNGEIVISLRGKTVHVPITVKGSVDAFQPDYVRDVMPVVSKLGCNAGTCHGSKDGKNGFKLSLRGYDPIYDIRAFTDDLGGRRINRAAADSSLMLLKATAAVPHEGGKVTARESDHYRVLRDWIAGGAKLDLSTPKVTKLEVFPTDPVVVEIGTRQQMRVVATYADGRRRDVTREAFVVSGNPEVAEPEKDKDALIKTLRRGEAPVLVRFEGNYAATTVTVMGDRSGFAWGEQPANNRIDELVAAKWQRMKILPSGLCDDYEFVRRIHLDLTGLPPSAQATLDFVNDKRPGRAKRDALIDSLIGNESFVDHWANKWSDMLMVNRKFLGPEGAKGLRDWIRTEVKRNTPYDEFVRKIITASGSNKTSPAASYFKILRTPEELMENTTHLFLATRFNCNKCHDHPFERWTQDQYYQLAAYFAQVDRRKDPSAGDKKIGGTAVEGAKPLFELISDKKDGDVIHERTGVVAAPSFPYPALIDRGETNTRRGELAAWITAPDNRYFAASYVNRLWGYMLGTGIIEPLDDIRAGNPPSNPELLAHLEREFIDSDFDPRHVLREICKSRTYQLSIDTNRWNEDDTINFSHAKARRLPAEVLYDTVYTALGARPNIPGVPPGTRASQLPDVGVDLPDGFLGNLGRPVRESSCECERSNGLQLGPVMALISGPTIGDAISDPGNVLAKLVDGSSDDRKLANEIFLRLLSRPATEAEIEASTALIANFDAEHDTLVAATAAREAVLKPETDKAETGRNSAIAAAKSALENYRGSVAEREAKLDAEHTTRLAGAKKGFADYDKTVPARLAKWQSSGAGTTQWITVTPLGTSSSAGSVLGVEGEGAVYALGAHGKGINHVVGASDLAGITGVRIEALTDKRLPKGGPGRSDNDGNFVITEFEISHSPLPAKDGWSVVADWGFDQPGDFEGWGSANQTKLEVAGGQLRSQASGDDSYFGVPVAAPAGAYVLEMSAIFPGTGKESSQLFWTSAKQEGWAESHATRITVERGGEAMTKYRFSFRSDSPLTALRLDPLMKKGESRFEQIRLIRADTKSPTKIKLENAKADFSQKSYDVATAIDGKTPDSGNGWAIAPQMGKNHTATFEIANPLPAGRGLFDFAFTQNFKSGQHSLGRFRISVTNSPKPINAGLPKPIAAALAVAADKRNDKQKKTILDHFRANDTEFTRLKTELDAAKNPRQRDAKLVGLEQALATAEKPLPVDPALASLRHDVALSEKQKANKRLTAAQDIAWAVINTPSFLFNR